VCGVCAHPGGKAEGVRTRLEDIGFYTLSDQRARTATAITPLMRCELILTGRCNFRCPYCRQVGQEIAMQDAEATLDAWMREGLVNVRFSGGEPLLHRGLPQLVARCRRGGVQRIAVSSNGSARWDRYLGLIDRGVDDFSISLDACCAEDGDRMAGGRKGAWARVVKTIRALAKRVYTTVGVVLTLDNRDQLSRTIQFAHELGVNDIRIIPAAQCAGLALTVNVPKKVWLAHPILAYRLGRLERGLPVRGIGAQDAHQCRLVLDDMAVMGAHHYPCIIYLREGGQPIGNVGPLMREERARWSRQHNTHADPICLRNCLDVCVEHNNIAARARILAERRGES
ncbi:MAG: radical SAM protein, partial [Pseudomonadota bacterium]